MALDAGFVADVLEGIEGTLGELIERVGTAELETGLDVLRSRVTALRVSIGSRVRSAGALDEPEEPVGAETR